MLDLNTIYNMDCLEGMKLLPSNSIDAIVTDPPYWLSFMGKKWDYDVPSKEIREEALRVLKPWWYLLAFAGTRTYHRMACAIEDAGFEVRDMIEWIYGCLSIDTEILTKNGWVNYNKITWNNPVFCYNVDRDIFEYHLPTNYFLYENKHTAYRIQSDHTDQIVSRNHRVAVEQDGRIVFKYAETLKQQENIPFLESVPEMSESIWDEHERTSYKEQILLWLCMKSYIREKEMNIEGYKLYVWEELWDMLKSVYDKEKQTLKVLLEQMQLNSEMTGISEALAQVKELMDRTIQTIVQSKDVMTELQVLEELRNTYKEEMKVCKSNDKICKMSDWLYWDGKKGLICDGAQTCCCKGNKKTTNEDWVCSSHKSQCRGQQNWKPDVIQDELRTQEIWTLKRYTTTSATITEIEYDWYVWCVEVPTWCFVARRNGKIFITGNSGFPKSLNIGKQISKMNWEERIDLWESNVCRWPSVKKGKAWFANLWWIWECAEKPRITKWTSEREWRGTALKPSHEPICMARKPLAEKTVAENVLKWGTGGINIDGSRVEANEELGRNNNARIEGTSYVVQKETMRIDNSNGKRFPANIIHDNSEEVRECFPESKGGAFPKTHGSSGFVSPEEKESRLEMNDSGNASRFFKSIIYQAKSSKAERNKGCEELELRPGGSNAKGYTQDVKRGLDRNRPVTNNHPTVKPIALMEYLVKLVSKEWAVVIDPFAWSGSTMIACKRLWRQYIGFELDQWYCEIAENRVASY